MPTQHEPPQSLAAEPDQAESLGDLVDPPIPVSAASHTTSSTSHRDRVNSSSNSNTFIFPIRSVYNHRPSMSGGVSGDGVVGGAGVAGGVKTPAPPPIAPFEGDLRRASSGNLESPQSEPRADPMSFPNCMLDMLENSSTARPSSPPKSFATLSHRSQSPNMMSPLSSPPLQAPPPQLGATARSPPTLLENDDAGVANLVNDFSGIVRLGDARPAGAGGTAEGSSTALPHDSAGVPGGKTPPPLTAAHKPGQAKFGDGMLRKLPHTSSASMRAQTQDSVRNFVKDQAHTVTMADPNAATPSPASDLAEVSSLGSTQPPSDGTSLSSGSTGALYSHGVRTNHASTGVTSLQDDLTEEEPFTTFRFQHRETEEGHHVITGREGELHRCEDEPITIPGAIQGFGVLILLEEDYETGNMTVRQVSENSTEILGLSPKYLFRLPCFSRILTPDQEDVLRDNVESLPYPDDDYAEMEGEYQGPQVFRLRGHGEPGSDDTQGETTSTSDSKTSNRRREWTCWVAASRPKMDSWIKYDENGQQLPIPDLIVLEFELERDTYNPLTEPIDSQSDMVDMQSPGSSDLQQAARPTAHTWSSRGSSTRESQPENSPSPEGAGSGTRPPLSTNASGNTDQNSIPGGSVASTSFSQKTFNLNGLEHTPPLDQVLESTTNYAKPLRSLVGMRRAGTEGPEEMSGTSSSGRGSRGSRGTKSSRGSGRRRANRHGATSSSDALDVVTVLNQINDQLSRAQDLDSFLKITVGLVKDLCRFSRVVIYQFDEEYNGKVVTELVDWGTTTDLWKGLMFPSADIPPQARELYRINKVRFLYDRSQMTARLVLRDKSDLEHPLDMTHCFLRAMSPIHIKYLANMNVRSSMSISIMAFGKLWGLIACHSYGNHGMRVAFPVRQMLRILSDVVSRNVERLRYAQRLKARQLINTAGFAGIPGLGGAGMGGAGGGFPRAHNGAETAPSTDSQGYIVSNADELLQIFDADSGLLVINDGCKLLGQSDQAHTMLAIAEYLRIAKFDDIVSSHHITRDFPDLILPRAWDTIAGLLYVPLTHEAGQDFIVLLRKGQIDEVKWAGRPYIDQDAENKAVLEPRSSFKLWTTTVTGRSRHWTDDQVESARVLSLIYGKFIHVWRERQSAMMSNQLTAILLSNTSHMVRTPLSQIINTLELAMAGDIDSDTRNMLENSHQASRALLFHVHDLLDLTRIETGNETAFNDPFDLKQIVGSTVRLYQTEATRRGIGFNVSMADDLPPTVIGDSRKVKTVVSNLLANAVKYTSEGSIEVICRLEPGAEHEDSSASIEIIVSDTGCGIPQEKLEAMFVTLEGAEDRAEGGGVGLGLAVVARIVEQLNGQLRAESEVGKGTKFCFTCSMGVTSDFVRTGNASGSLGLLANDEDTSSSAAAGSPDSGVEGPSSGTRAKASLGLSKLARSREGTTPPPQPRREPPAFDAKAAPESAPPTPPVSAAAATPATPAPSAPAPVRSKTEPVGKTHLRILVVEDDIMNSQILQKRLKMDKHAVGAVENGQEAVTLIASDWDFDAIIMDIQMPIMDGFEAAKEIRRLEATTQPPNGIDRARLDGRIPIFAHSASLYEDDRGALGEHFDGWLLKPLQFNRLRAILDALHDTEKRHDEIYCAGQWERGGYLHEANDCTKG